MTRNIPAPEDKLGFDDISLESLGTHLLFGPVDTDSIRGAVEFILKANILQNSDITLAINTVGGDCSDGFALIDVMEASRLHVRTLGMGNIMSMGMLVMCAGAKGKRVMLKNSSAMAHQFHSWTEGKFHELMSTQKAFEYLRTQMVTHFLRHTKMNEKQINDIMFGPTDRYLSPSECKKLGIVDHVVDELPELNLDLSPSRPQPVSAKSKRQARQ